MRCAIYTRVSTDEQATSEHSSLRRQERVCRNYVDIHTEKGWTVAGAYDDPGYSGKDFLRPDLQELHEDVRAGKLDAVVTYTIDRVSRSLKDFARLVGSSALGRPERDLPAPATRGGGAAPRPGRGSAAERAGHAGNINPHPKVPRRDNCRAVTEESR